MKKWHWILLAVFTYLVCLVIYMPAIFVTQHVQKNSQNSIVIEGVEGTLFSGMAKSVAYEGFRLNNVNWELSPFSLLLLRANIDVTGGAIRNTEQIYLNGKLIMSLLDPQSFSAFNTQLIVPAKSLLAQVNLPVPVVASGRFRVDIESMDYNKGCQQLAGKGSWIQAAMNVNQKPLNLGGFNAVLSCETPALAMQISPDNGIELDAKILLEPEGKYSAKGQFTIPDNFPNEVKQGAIYFGKAKGKGKYDLNIKSK